VFVPRNSSTSVATWFWQTEGRSAECVILGVRPSSSCLGSHPIREEFLSAHIHSPPSGRLIDPSLTNGTNPPEVSSSLSHVDFGVYCLRRKIMLKRRLSG
jgi:hypothetical protein